MASTEVRQKLHDFLISKSAKDLSVSSAGFPLSCSKLWYRCVTDTNTHTIHYTLIVSALNSFKNSLLIVFMFSSSAHPGPAEQSSPPLGETPPTFKYPLTSGLDYREDFPLRKTGRSKFRGHGKEFCSIILINSV